MDSSQNYKLFKDQSAYEAQLDYQVKYEQEMKRKGLSREGAKFQQLRKKINENLPGLLQNEQHIDKNLDQITDFDLDDRV